MTFYDSLTFKCLYIFSSCLFFWLFFFSFCRRGSMLSTAIFVFAATSPLNGYFGGSLYARQGGGFYTLFLLFLSFVFVWEDAFAFHQWAMLISEPKQWINWWSYSDAGSHPKMSPPPFPQRCCLTYWAYVSISVNEQIPFVHSSFFLLLYISFLVLALFSKLKLPSLSLLVGIYSAPQILVIFSAAFLCQTPECKIATLNNL